MGVTMGSALAEDAAEAAGAVDNAPMAGTTSDCPQLAQALAPGRLIRPQFGQVAPAGTEAPGDEIGADAGACNACTSAAAV